jgi:rod shape-determining protein MreB
MEVYGKNLMNGAPGKVTATDSQVRTALAEPAAAIVETVRNALERTSPDLVADIHDSGLLMVGGGALLRGLDKLIAEAIQVPVRIDDDPLTAVVRGTAMVLDKKAGYGDVFLPE